MKYRPEVDGLRALAVLPVVFFHAGVPGVSGGYVGVDIFFVISGYLISRILFEDMQAGRYSLLDFYDRRIRRIFPALLVMVAVSFVVATLLYLPADLRAFTKTVVATFLFVSNILFWKETNYFAAAADTKPLLHTWSLAVEEQFYIVFPIFLALIFRLLLPRLRLAVIICLVLSFLLSVYGVYSRPEATFFLLPTRAWELLAGSLLGLGLLPPIASERGREAASAFGAALILIAIFTYGPATPFPGAAALLPVLGAALIIHTGQGTLVGRCLSLRAFVAIGLISYSLYLWHWPIIVFAQYYLLEKLHGWHSLAVILLAGAISFASWRFVELPFRNRARFSRRAVFAGSAAACSLVLAAALAGYVGRGWEGRLNETALRFAAASKDFSPRRNACHSSDNRPLDADHPCIYGAPVPPSFAVWGDSHAVELAYALGEVANNYGRSLAHFSGSACPPALQFSQPQAIHCAEQNAKILAFLQRTPDISTVFLISSYRPAFYQDQIVAGVALTAEKLRAAHKRVVLVYPIPTSTVSVPQALARLSMSGATPSDYGIDFATYFHANGDVIAALDKLDVDGRVRPAERLCHEGRCAVLADGKALYFDEIHPSVAGARYLAGLFSPYLAAGASTAAFPQ